MRDLYICNTVYHVMVVCCIKKYLNFEREATLWISDHTKQAENIWRRMSQMDSGFGEIKFIETKIYQETKYSNKQIIKASTKKVQKQLCELDDDFTQIYMANFDFFMCALMEEWKDRDIVYSLYEDGLGTYSYEGRLFEKDKGNPLTKAVHSIYVFYPDKLSWETDKPLVKIPCELKTDSQMRQAFNEMFSYTALQDTYDARFIFFEDGFAEWDGREDMELLNSISQEIGKENLFVKSHPRNDAGKYVDAGYAVNVDTYVPWEIIAMNIDMERKVLITFYSQAVIMPYMLTGIKYKAIILGRMLSCDDERADQYFQYMDRYYYSQYKDIFFVPESMEELKQYLADLPG